jgi:hypothetical protein
MSNHDHALEICEDKINPNRISRYHSPHEIMGRSLVSNPRLISQPLLVNYLVITSKSLIYIPILAMHHLGDHHYKPNSQLSSKPFASK